jgi:CDP-2,3-bis-(O-geranylgeranyl)-sn-glycerol synthase
MWFLIGTILHSLYYISPAYCANSFAVFGGGKPVDFGRSWRGKRIFGDGKSWRGLVIGVVAGTLFGLMWFYLSKSGPLNEVYFGVFDFRITDPLFGLYLSIGAMIGDLVNSFVKRQLGLKRGAPFWGGDQWNLMFGGLLVAYFFAPTFIIWEEFLALLIITFAIHLFGNQIAYYTKRKKVRW